ncbi:glycosyl hydrolases family 2 domain-containing protein [Hirsutella rhossiliensis]|uniref:Glycosyl hydrolases family 2 domain-containing protein n=1 Tax=Hirsutella rhossiliensis TaxID=111463 RepID=A0A9P8MMS5_9HYPO|nr:glycosyl hydrolases family 2 domain-containing protein [Hirsutella rhossiliensis]KAH0958238.1 glycosyl hydrolases family 2 domain-containing protein [Hirsutella rhossiliensis]
MLGPTVVTSLFIVGSAFKEAATSKGPSAQPITSAPGQRGVIPHWDLQSSSLVEKDLARVSEPGHDTSAWYRIGTSRCTIMGCLLAAGIYNDTDLWYSDNLSKFDARQFSVPWVYRNEFSLAAKDGQHFMLETHGITSRADIFLNGKQVALHKCQAGSYGGHTYDITSLVEDDNALVINAHPADFNYDLVQGFVDWNPPPPDNGSGVWRDIAVKQTGPVSMGRVSVSIDMEPPVEKSPAKVIVRAMAQNLEDHAVQLKVKSTVTGPSGYGELSSCQDAVVNFGPGESQPVEIAHMIDKPRVWWPKQWGEQPLYETKMTFMVDSKVSDVSRQSFGIRTVTSKVNGHNDTMFTVNGHPFQVIGGGYTADQFFRWDRERFLAIAKYSLDMGLNTIRLEGMMEHPELYETADELGIMIIAGWVCCSKWEAWKHNHDLQLDPVPYWVENDYQTANASMMHEAAMLQPHPSVMAFLVGSDSWPNDRATRIYVDALRNAHWQTPIIASAARRGYPEILGPSGMKMDGPYDWVPPNYWFDTEPSKDRLGAAFGFGSELGAGVGTPELGSLRKFLSQGDMNDLWARPDKDLFHMSSNRSSFRNRKIYNQALFQRYGPPKSLDDYLLKAQMMDYEATRAQHEGYSSRWNANRPATGTIYWMLNNAWPGLHWNLFDSYMHPAGSYFGTKMGCRIEHVAYDYVDQTVWLINHSLVQRGKRKIVVELIDLDGNILSTQSFHARTQANTAERAGKVSKVSKVSNVGFLRLILFDEQGVTVSRNVYWLSNSIDALSWKNSTWYHTPVSEFADLTALSSMKTATVTLRPSCSSSGSGDSAQKSQLLELENQSSTPAFFIRLNLVDEAGVDVNPVQWSDNYVTLWPNEKLQLLVGYSDMEVEGGKVTISGGNIKPSEILLGGCNK